MNRGCRVPKAAPITRAEIAVYPQTAQKSSGILDLRPENQQKVQKQHQGKHRQNRQIKAPENKKSAQIPRMGKEETDYSVYKSIIAAGQEKIPHHGSPQGEGQAPYKQSLPGCPRTEGVADEQEQYAACYRQFNRRTTFSPVSVTDRYYCGNRRKKPEHIFCNHGSILLFS